MPSALPPKAGKALTQRCEIAEAEVQRLAEENARLRQQYSEASDEVIQVRIDRSDLAQLRRLLTHPFLTARLNHPDPLRHQPPQLTADRDYYRLCLHDATGSGCGGSSKEGHDEPEAEDDTATDPSPLANQRGPFADHLRPYLHEIRALQHRVKELEQAQTQAAQQQQQQQNRRRSSASTFLFSSLLAEGAATAGAGGASTLLLPSLLLTAAEAGPQQPQPPQSQRQETDLEKDLRLATEAETGAFVRAHQEMSATVADLTRGIELKERLAAQLCESIKRYEVMRRVYEEKLQAMEEETARCVVWLVG